MIWVLDLSLRTRPGTARKLESVLDMETEPVEIYTWYNSAVYLYTFTPVYLSHIRPLTLAPPLATLTLPWSSSSTSLGNLSVSTVTFLASMASRAYKACKKMDEWSWRVAPQWRCRRIRMRSPGISTPHRVNRSVKLPSGGPIATWDVGWDLVVALVDHICSLSVDNVF